MQRYETLFLCVPEITADETTAIQTSIEKLLSQSQANLISFDRWGKYRLAYPVHKHEYGVYFLVRYEVDPAQKTELLASVNTLLAIKYNELVMRHLSSLLEPNKSLEYQRPESLEEAPARESDSGREGRSFGKGRRGYQREDTRPTRLERHEEGAEPNFPLESEEIDESLEEQA